MPNHTLRGSIILEPMFAWHGVGSRLITRVTSCIYSPVTSGILLMYTITFVTLNLVIDGIYAMANLRIRF